MRRVHYASFKRPGEPIVETPRDALRFFMSSTRDTLYIMGYQVRHTRASRQSVSFDAVFVAVNGR
jgi:hypothetical protein